MKTILYTIPATPGSHTVAMHDGANLREVAYDGVSLLLVAEADVSQATIPTAVAVVRASTTGVDTPPDRVYVGAAPVGVLGQALVVYR